MNEKKKEESLINPNFEIEKPNGDLLSMSLSTDEAILGAEKQIEAFKKISNISLRLTTYRDWIDQGGYPYLIESGASKIAKVWGIDYSGIGVEKEWLEDDVGRYYGYTAKGRAYSKTLKCSVEDIGTCSQRDKFFAFAKGQWKLPSEIDEMAIKKASVTNLYNRLLKRICGLNNLTYEQLDEANIDTKKIQKVDYQSGSKKVEKTATPEEINKQKEIWDWLMQITAGNDELARERLKLETGFKPKDGSDWVEGKKDPKYLTGKWLNITHRKIKEIFDKQFSGEEAEK